MRRLRTKTCTLKRLVAAVLLMCGAVWLKTGKVPQAGAVAALMMSLLFVLELAHCALEFEALELIVVNALFTGVVNRLVQVL